MNISDDPNDELSEYEKLQDTGHYDRRLKNSRIRVTDILYGMGDYKKFENLYFWDVSKEEVDNVVRYYKDNRALFEGMDKYDTDVLDESVEFWKNNKDDY